MKNKTIEVLGLLFLLSLIVPAQGALIENGWKQIKIFETKRDDVEKHFGPPKPSADKIHTIYQTADGNVVIVYSDDPCSTALGTKGDFKLQKDVVIEYEVYLEKPFPLSQLKWNKDLYKREVDPGRLQVFAYDNRKDGIWITTGMVDGVEVVGSMWFYGALEQKRRLRCG